MRRYGQVVKKMARYQQYRGVQLTIQRLRKGQNRQERSGIIWHTQGSGKSLTMMFMVRAMRRLNEFADWKIVFVTDRTQLEEQLSETSQAIGRTVKVAEWIKPDSRRPGRSLQELIENPAPDLVMGMIHKFREYDLNEIFPELNPSPHILIMIDEAHRSQYKLLGANLDRAMPNAARVGYTGTPIDKTERTFGEYIDKYPMRQAIEDGVTLEVIYEGRTHNAEVEDKQGMDARFADVFSDYNLMERLQILGFASRRAYLESLGTIRAKARDMIEHYVQHVFPSGYKAQVVATSREAAVRYKTALDGALQEVVSDLRKHNPRSIDIDLLAALETAVVISDGHNDKPHIKAHTDSAAQRLIRRRFKLPFHAEEDGGDAAVNGRIGVVIVNNMLIAGFDAPLEQVMYLDRVMTDHNLLQAIARVNRVADEYKDNGFVVDYVGVGHHLKHALDAYAEREQAEILASISNPEQELNELAQAHREIVALLQQYGLDDFSDPDAYFDLFYDEDIRFEYILAFKKLTRAFNVVMPNKDALDYWQDYLNLLAINEMASRHLHDDRISMRSIPPKLRAIADEFLRSKGIEQKVAPISIIDAEFQSEVGKRKRAKTKAAEVEHAIRHYIDINMPDDPELFVSFSEMLEQILADFKDNWDKIYKELEKLRQKIRNKEQEETYGLDRRRQMPIFRIFKSNLWGDHDLSEDEITQNVDLTQNIFNLIEREIQAVGFWDSIPAQNRLIAELQKLMLSERFASYPNMFSKRKELTSRLMEWARAKHDIIVTG